MRIIFRLCLVFAMGGCLFGCSQEASTSNFGSGGERGEESGLDSAQQQASIELSPDRGGPNAAVTLTGRGFPVDSTVNLYLSSAETPGEPIFYGQATVDGLGELNHDLVMPTLWPDGPIDAPSEIFLEVELADQQTIAFSNFIFSPANALDDFYFPEGNFSLLLPQQWEMTEAQQTALGSMTLVGLPPLTPGDPAHSIVLVADAAEMDPHIAADLLCGGGCQADVRLQRFELAGQEVRSMLIQSDGAPALEWFFIEQNGKLIYLTLHDPVTLQSLEPLLETIEFEVVEVQSTADSVAAIPEEELTVTPTQSPTPLPTPTPTPTPAVSPTPAAVLDSEAGPLEVLTNFLTDVSREAPSGRTFISLSEEIRPEEESLASLYSLLQISRSFTFFDLERQQGGGVVISATLRFGNNAAESRLITMAREDNVWRIQAVEAPATPTPAAVGSTTPTTSTAETPAPTEGESDG